MKMKKVFKILSAVALFAASLVLGSCSEDDEIVQVLQGPANVWCRMPVEYKNSDDSDTANLYAYFYYTETAKKIGSADLPAGLSIVITANTTSQSSIIEGLTESAYILKKFPKDESTTVGDSDDDTAAITFNGSRAKWTAIYWGKDPLHQSANQSSNAPTQLTSGIPLDANEIKDCFSWKRILANYLLSILEE